MPDDVIVEACSCRSDIAVIAPADQNPHAGPGLNRHDADSFDCPPYRCERNRRRMPGANHFKQETGTLTFNNDIGGQAQLIGDLVDFRALVISSWEECERGAQDVSPRDLGLSCKGRCFGDATRRWPPRSYGLPGSQPAGPYAGARPRRKSLSPPLRRGISRADENST